MDDRSQRKKGAQQAAGVASDLSYDELLKRYETLTSHLSGFTRVQQQLITARDRLDRELERVTALHRFNTRVSGMSDLEALTESTAEAVVDVFELAFGGLWLVRDDALAMSGPCLVGLDTACLPRTFLSSRLEEVCREGVVLLDSQREPQLDALGLSHLVLGACRAGDQMLALIIGGIDGARRAFYTPIDPSCLGPVVVFKQMVGTLLQAHADRALIEQQLQTIRVSEERLAQSLDGGGMGLWDWWIPESTVFFSDRWLSMLGYLPDDLPHSFETWERLLHPDDRDRAQLAIDDYFAGRTTDYRNEIRLKRKDGSWSWIMTRGKLLRDPDGQPHRMVGVHVDINERKASEQAIQRAIEEQRRARREAEHANQAKSDFLATMSHEIRTPMNGVLGMLQVLESTPLSTEQQGFVRVARDSATVLLHLIDDILDLSKVEAGRIELEDAPYDPGHLVDGIVRLLAVRANPGVTVRAERDPGLPAWVRGDAARVRQVLSNLLGNALKFTRVGEVVVRVAYRIGADGGVLHMAIADTGVGIADDSIERIFEPFTQADASTTRRFGGTGLGLAICRHLVELMGGRIGVESTLGVGSTFSFHVRAPVAEQRADEKLSRTTNDLRGGGLTGRRVLVVEDNPVNQQVARLFLEKLGVEVVSAMNGLEGLEAWRAGSFSLVFMDVQMPVMAGLEATRRIREEEQSMGRTSVPIVALTANAMPESRQACLDAGMSDFLAKPFRFADVAQRLREWLGESLSDGGDRG